MKNTFYNLLAMLALVIAASLFAAFLFRPEPIAFKVSEAARKNKEANLYREQEKQKYLDRDQYSKQPICYSPLEISFSQVLLTVKRSDLASYGTQDGEEYWQMNRRCEIKALDNVSSIGYPNLAISDARFKPDSYISTYKRNLKLIKDGRKNGLSFKFENGIERIILGNTAFYIAPQDLISTYGKEPATFVCGSYGVNPDLIGGFSSCNGLYRYSPDVIVWYRMFNSSGPPKSTVDLILEKDKWARDYIQTLNIRSKN